MELNPYLKDVKQTNGCRTWENPNLSELIQPPRGTEIFIRNLPKHLFEVDIIPHFERFGLIYQFRLMVDYDNCNRGIAYLIFVHEKSAIECLDLMGYHIIEPGVMLDVIASQQRSHLLALNIPSIMSDAEIEKGFRNLFSGITKVCVRHDPKMAAKGTCTAVLEFPDHKTALTAKQWSGVGSVNLWHRNVKILWAQENQIEDMLKPRHEVTHILVHNVPENFDPDDFGFIMCELVSPQEIITIRPMNRDWLVQFANPVAAFTIFAHMDKKFIGGSQICTEQVNHERLKTLATFTDFDFELRCFCLANYCDPPIFIYGRIIPHSKTQLCSVIIKDNRKNRFTSFFIEMCYDQLVEIHARVCEALLLILMELKEVPKVSVVVKCTPTTALLVGAIVNMGDPQVLPTATGLPQCLYLEEVFALCKMSFELITSAMLDDIHSEYKMILKQQDLHHQYLCGIFSDQNMLGCVDPIYRHGKPMRFQMDNRHLILAMCDADSSSNVGFKNFPALHELWNLKALGYKQVSFKVEQFELMPMTATQSQEVHFTYRPFIEFSRVDTYGPLSNLLDQEGRHNGIAAPQYQQFVQKA